MAEINQQSQEIGKDSSNMASLNGKDESQYLILEDCLESTFADEGTQTMLEVTVKSQPQVTCTWYKEGTMLQTNQRIHITSFKKQNLEVFKLEIRNLKVEDSGIYSVICQNNFKKLSSHATLLVANVEDTDGTIYYPAQGSTKNKVVLEPKHAQVKQDDIIELEAAFENKVDEIAWYKNNDEIIEDFRTIILKSQRSSVLTIMKSALNDTGTYYVVGRSCVGRLTSSVALVYVTPVLPDLNSTDTGNESNNEPNHKQAITSTATSIVEDASLVVNPLESAVASLGSGVMFNCSFVLNDGIFYFVTWKVGQYVVERTNRQFCVLNKGGDFFLYIKRLESDMAGQVICELWRAVPCEPGQNKFITATKSSLNIAPRCILQSETQINETKKLFLAKSADEIFNIYGQESSNTLQMASSNGNLAGPDDVVTITYCRLDENGLFYFSSSKGKNNINAKIECIAGEERKIYIKIDKTSLPVDCWYAIAVAQSDGSYVEVGISSEPCVGMKEPPPMTVVKIRMLPTYLIPTDAATESSVFLNIAPQEEDVAPLKCAHLRSIQEFLFEYKITGGRLGLGSFGSVLLAQDDNGKYYAAKKVRTTCQSSRDKAIAEYRIMKRLQHPKVIQLVEGFQDKLNFIIVMEYVWGGELFDRVVLEEHIQEEDVVSYVRQICEALVYIHKQNIVHLDLKPENIICRSPNSRCIKIIDFGIAKELHANTEVKVLEGTKEYISPEILNYERVTTACDMWSLGVVTYILLSGLTPFYSETWLEMSTKITRAEYGYDDEVFDQVSWLSRNFVDRLLMLNPPDRLTAEQALQHSWLKYGPPQGVSARYSMWQTRENLKCYLAAYRSKWQRARNVIFAANRLLASGHASAARNSCCK